MKELRFIVKISRPRFWLYLAGTYLVGFTLGATTTSDFYTWEFVLHFLYFALPANIFLYGINDYFDTDTDQFNEKKQDKEHLLKNKEKRKLLIYVLTSLALGIILLAWSSPSTMAIIYFAAFLVLGAAYSAPPLRLKARPILDSTSNILYAMPGFLAYEQIAGQTPTTAVFIAAFAWTISMHLFSAIPDIAADKKANLRTTAVLLGRNASLWLCFILWSTFFFSVIATGAYYPWSLALIVYAFIPFFLIRQPSADLSRVYWKFPYLNAAIGFAWFVLAASALL